MAIQVLPPPGDRREGNATGWPSVRPSRRDLLSAAGFTALAGIAAVAIARPDAKAAELLPVTTGQDAELIALAGRFMALQTRIDAINAREETATDDELSAVITAQADLLEEMHPIIVTTPAGHRARARVFVKWHSLDSETEAHSEIDHDRLWPILRDLIGEAA